MQCPSDLRTLARLLGGDVVGHQVLAPGPGHSPKDRSLSIRLSATAPEGFIAFSHAGDNFPECRDYIKRALGIATDRTPPQTRTPRAPQDDDRDARVLMFTKRIISEIVPLADSPGENYLHDVRGIDTSAIADVLERTDAIGWHPSVLFLEEGHALHDKRIGCIVGVMTDAITGKPTGGVSRTYVHQGRKVTKARGLGPAGIVRLSLDEDTLSGLHLAEGLETALTAMSIGIRPTWATGSAAILAKLPVLGGIESISIIADHDANGAGERAARELQARWEIAGREVRIWKSKTLGDLNDFIKGN
jgi:putative DNA primase/helicase